VGTEFFFILSPGSDIYFLLPLAKRIERKHKKVVIGVYLFVWLCRLFLTLSVVYLTSYQQPALLKSLTLFLFFQRAILTSLCSGLIISKLSIPGFPETSFLPVCGSDTGFKKSMYQELA